MDKGAGGGRGGDDNQGMCGKCNFAWDKRCLEVDRRFIEMEKRFLEMEKVVMKSQLVNSRFEEVTKSREEFSWRIFQISKDVEMLREEVRSLGGNVQRQQQNQPQPPPPPQVHVQGSHLLPQMMTIHQMNQQPPQQQVPRSNSSMECNTSGSPSRNSNNVIGNSGNDANKGGNSGKNNSEGSVGHNIERVQELLVNRARERREPNDVKLQLPQGNPTKKSTSEKVAGVINAGDDARNATTSTDAKQTHASNNNKDIEQNRSHQQQQKTLANPIPPKPKNCEVQNKTGESSNMPVVEIDLTEPAVMVKEEPAYNCRNTESEPMDQGQQETAAPVTSNKPAPVAAVRSSNTGHSNQFIQNVGFPVLTPQVASTLLSHLSSPVHVGKNVNLVHQPGNVDRNSAPAVQNLAPEVQIPPQVSQKLTPPVQIPTQIGQKSFPAVQIQMPTTAFQISTETGHKKLAPVAQKLAPAAQKLAPAAQKQKLSAFLKQLGQKPIVQKPTQVPGPIQVPGPTQATQPDSLQIELAKRRQEVLRQRQWTIKATKPTSKKVEPETEKMNQQNPSDFSKGSSEMTDDPGTPEMSRISESNGFEGFGNERTEIRKQPSTQVSFRMELKQKLQKAKSILASNRTGVKTNKKSKLSKAKAKGRPKLDDPRERQFVCTLCDNRYLLKTSLVEHFKRGHKIAGPDLKSFMNEKDEKVKPRVEPVMKTHRCLNCNEKFKGSQALAHHKKSQKCLFEGYTCSATGS